jgi:hypothetical protein
MGYKKFWTDGFDIKALIAQRGGDVDEGDIRCARHANYRDVMRLTRAAARILGLHGLSNG